MVIANCSLPLGDAEARGGLWGALPRLLLLWTVSTLPVVLGPWCLNGKLDVVLFLFGWGEGEGLFLVIHRLSCLLAPLVKSSASPLRRPSSSKFVGVWFGVDLCVWGSPQLSVNAALVTTVLQRGGRGWEGSTYFLAVAHSMRFHTSSLAHKGQSPQPFTAWNRLERGSLWVPLHTVHCWWPWGPSRVSYTPQATLEHSLRLLVHHGFWPFWVTFLFSCANMAGW